MPDHSLLQMHITVVLAARMNQKLHSVLRLFWYGDRVGYGKRL